LAPTTVNRIILKVDGVCGLPGALLTYEVVDVWGEALFELLGPEKQLVKEFLLLARSVVEGIVERLVKIVPRRVVYES
jgi:hypothetical protein